MPDIIERIDDRIDRTIAAGTTIDMQMGGVRFTSFVELMEFAKTMACAGPAVPPHCREEVVGARRAAGTCLAICTKALRFGFDPFALAEHSYVMKKAMEVKRDTDGGGRVTEKVDVDTIAYDSFVIRAIIEAHAPIVGRIRYKYEGEGDELVCTASALPRGEKESVSAESPTLGERKKAIGYSDKGNLKGSPLWLSKPKQQLGYDTGRDLCRLHFPEILLGWYDKDELEEGAVEIKATTPSVGDRLRGRAQKPHTEGFETKKIEHQISEVVPDPAIPAQQGEKVAVEVAGSGPAAPNEAATTSPGEPSPPPPKQTQAQARRAEKERPAKVAKQDNPVEDAPETPWERGTRLLALQKTKAAITDLRNSVAEELGSAEAKKWHKLCDDAMEGLPK